MDKKQKARKHLLRRLITNAALAGTAFSTFGGALANTMEVKAHEYRDDFLISEKEDLEKLIRIAVTSDRGNGDRKKALADLRSALKTASIETLHSLLLGLDNAHMQYGHGTYQFFSDYLRFENDNPRDFYHERSGLSLASVLIQEIRARIISNDKRGEEITEKNAELIQIKDKLRNLENLKNKIEAQLQEKGFEAESKGKELDETKEKLTSESRRANLNGLAKIELEKQRDVAKDQVAELSAQLEKVTKDHDEFAKLAAAAQADYEKELANDDQKINELSDNLKAAEEFYNETQAKLVETEKAKADMLVELENAQKALETAEQNMAEFSSQVEGLSAELESSKAEAEELKAKAEEVDKELASTKEAKASLEKEIEEMKAKQAEEVAKLEALLKEKGADISRLETELANKVKAFEEKDKMSEQEKGQFQADIDRLQKEIAHKVAPKEQKQEQSQAKPADKMAPAEQAKNELPSTGEKAANPLLVAAGLTFLVGAGTYAYAGRGKKD